MSHAMKSNGAAIKISASDLAFRVGQKIEAMVMDHAIALAKKEALPGSKVTVTVNHVRASLLENLPEKLLGRIGI
jgi:hypothetical protein